VGLIALCPNCHKTKHVGLAQMNGEIDIVINQLMKVNQWDYDKSVEYIHKSFDVWKKRSQHQWELDISYLDRYIDEVKLNTSNTIKLVEPIFIWTDGSCYRKIGGIGVYMKYKDKEKSIRIGYKNTKIGRMELKAIIIALRHIKNKNSHIILYSDSQYVVKGINIWLQGWIARCWSGIANVDLWEQFICEYDKFQKERVKFIHVKGHTEQDNFKYNGNEIADMLAYYRTQKFYHKNDLIL
jgi:ribonuclease HI